MGYRLLAALTGVVALAASATSYAQEKSTWDTIQERKTIRIGVAQAEPWAFMDPLSKEWQGIAVSYGKAISEALGVEPEFVEVTWGTAVPALQAGQIDLMPNLSTTPERALSIEYTNNPISYSGLSVLLPDDIQVETWDELDKPEITFGVNQGSSQDAFLTKQMQNAKIMRFSSYAEVIAAYQTGNVNAAAMYHPSLALLAKNAGSGHIVIPQPVRLSFSDTAMRREDDKRLRDWLATANNFYYTLGISQEWYEDFLRGRGIDPKDSPPIQREAW